MRTINRKYRTCYLTAKTNFLVGASSLFNLSGNHFLFNYSKDPYTADHKALACDWGVIGQDQEKAVKIFRRNLKQKA